MIKSITKEEKIESLEKTSEDITNIEPIETNLKNESDKEKVVDKPVKIDSKKEIPISNKEAQNKSTNNILKLEGTGQGFKGPIQVEVTLEDDKIIGIEILSNNDDGKWFDRAKRKTIERILENQNTEIDYVAGATFSSNGIIEAAKDALNKK
ncbi:MAG: FMN-binding protein [Fusobacteriaceae bacterium]|nr:FMN-binding protein [Fusobacteriaceae bacterium]MBP6467237.1 FMN-binding protein [Fusobacteriaceae bacterium]MBP9595786.1 FMN-binding protein [Fusobacteriaceae bacterium]MBU9917776.1 FMN-binding protein [Fusobacteriaceae bacterium]